MSKSIQNNLIDVCLQQDLYNSILILYFKSKPDKITSDKIQNFTLLVLSKII